MGARKKLFCVYVCECALTGGNIYLFPCVTRATIIVVNHHEVYISQLDLHVDFPHVTIELFVLFARTKNIVIEMNKL